MRRGDHLILRWVPYLSTLAATSIRGRRRKDARGARAQSAAAAAVMLVTAAGCGSHRLAPNAVPGPEEHHHARPEVVPRGPLVGQRRRQPRLHRGEGHLRDRQGRDSGRQREGAGHPAQVLDRAHRGLRACASKATPTTAPATSYNLQLSARRSLAVCDWLVDHGVDNNRLHRRRLREDQAHRAQHARRRAIGEPAHRVPRRGDQRPPLHEQRTPPRAARCSTSSASTSARRRLRRWSTPGALRPPPPPFKPTGDEVNDVHPSAAGSATPATGSSAGAKPKTSLRPRLPRPTSRAPRAGSGAWLERPAPALPARRGVRPRRPASRRRKSPGGSRGRRTADRAGW